jgi:hypothetical protein
LLTTDAHFLRAEYCLAPLGKAPARNYIPPFAVRE